MTIDAKLSAMNLQLPPAPKPVAAYIPAVRTGNLFIVSGQLPMSAGVLLATGKVPSAVAIDKAQIAARQCVMNALAALRGEIADDWSRLIRVVRLGVFVQSDDTFAEQHLVANGASELLQNLFGEAGRHARAAVGVNSLPLNASVEVEAMFQIGD